MTEVQKEIIFDIQEVISAEVGKIKTELAMTETERFEFNAIKQLKMLVIESVQEYFTYNYNNYLERNSSALFLSHSKEGFERAIKFEETILAADVSSKEIKNMIYAYLKIAGGNWKDHSFKTLLAHNIAPESKENLKQFRTFLDKNEFKSNTDSIATSKPKK
ncbi:MAG: hypothetical protein ABI597_00895 [Gammaproteobacteria bacterium]